MMYVSQCAWEHPTLWRDYAKPKKDSRVLCVRCGRWERVAMVRKLTTEEVRKLRERPRKAR
jgi:hypothetical protein